MITNLSHGLSWRLYRFAIKPPLTTLGSAFCNCIRMSFSREVTRFLNSHTPSGEPPYLLSVTECLNKSDLPLTISSGEFIASGVKGSKKPPAYSRDESYPLRFAHHPQKPNCSPFPYVINSTFLIFELISFLFSFCNRIQAP